MIFSTSQRFGIAARYLAFNGVMAVCATWAVQNLVREGLTLAPNMKITAEAEPSRVELFKQAEAAAAIAPQVPVPRVVVANSIPDMPVQVLAVRLDQAESLKAKPIKLKRKPGVRTANTVVRLKKAPDKPGELPTIAVQIEANAVSAPSTKRSKKFAFFEESSRDITNRTLGVLVALKN